MFELMSHEELRFCCHVHTCRYALRVVYVENVSEYVRLRLLSFYRSKVIAKAVRELFSIEGIKIDRKTVAKCYKRFKHPLCDSHSGSRPPTLEKRHFDFIDQKLEQNDELMPTFAICK